MIDYVAVAMVSATNIWALFCKYIPCLQNIFKRNNKLVIAFLYINSYNISVEYIFNIVNIVIVKIILKKNNFEIVFCKKKTFCIATIYMNDFYTNYKCIFRYNDLLL